MDKDLFGRAHPLECDCGTCTQANNWARRAARYNQCTGTTVTGRRCWAKVYVPATRCLNHPEEPKS